MKIEISNNSAIFEMDKDAALSNELNASNSPVLFGCRTGICGTCLVTIDELDGEVTPPSSDERELLEIIAPDNSNARLACMIKASCNIKLTYIGEK